MTEGDSSQEWAAPTEQVPAENPQGSYGNQWGQPSSWEQANYATPYPGYAGTSAPGSTPPGDQGPHGTQGYGPGFMPPPRPEVRPGIIPLRPLGLAEILDGAFQAIRKSPALILGLAFPMVAIVAILQAIMMASVLDSMSFEYLEMEADPDSTVLTTALSLMLFSYVAVPVVSGLLAVPVSRATIGQKITFAKFWSEAKGRIFPLIGFVLINMVLLAIPAAILVGIFMLLLEAEAIALMVLVGLGGMGLYVVYSLWLSTKLLFAPAITVLERQGPIQAVKRSWTLTRGSFWRLLGIYLLGQLLAQTVASIVSTPVIILGAIFAIQSTFWMAIMTAVGTAISILIAIPYTAAIMTLLYVDTRMRNEGLDIELARAAGATS